MQENISCQICNKVFDQISITLPCGYLVCAEHLNTDFENLNCPICNDHVINVRECLEMPRNKRILDYLHQQIDVDYQNETGEMANLNFQGNCFKIIKANSFIFRLHATDDEIIAGCADSQIKIWDKNTGICKRSFDGHVNGVWCLQVLDNDEIISCSSDHLIKLWKKVQANV